MMKGFYPLFHRQVMSYFCFSGSYVLMAVFLGASGLNFCGMISRSLQEPMEFGDMLFGSDLFWFAVLAVIAIITMRLFAEEKKSGSIELLLTAPITDTQLVMAKYFGALAFFIVLCGPLVLNASVIMAFSQDPDTLDFIPMIMGFVMFFLTGACYIAFGLFVSSVTRSQMVAGFLCFAGISTGCFSDRFWGIVFGSNIRGVLDHLSGINPVLDFFNGIIDTRPLVLCFSGIAFFLFATVKVIEARQWKLN